MLACAILLCTSFQKDGNGNSSNPIVGSWELVRYYWIDSSFNWYGRLKVYSQDTTYPHGGSFLVHNFRQDYTRVSIYWVSIFDEDGTQRGSRMATERDTYVLQPGQQLVLTYLPHWLPLEPPNPLLNYLKDLPPDPKDIFTYTIANGILTLYQSYEEGGDLGTIIRHHTLIFKKQ